MMTDQLSMELSARPIADKPTGQWPSTVTPISPSIEMILSQAVQAGRTGAELQSLLDVFERMQAKKSEQAFNAAFAQFKATCPKVVRRTEDANPRMARVDRNGVRRQRTYASLEDIAAVVDGPLSANGLTYSWTSALVTPDGLLTREFVVRHIGGHSSIPVASPPIPIEGGVAYTAISGGRGDTSASPAQRYGIADTYAMRLSMKAGLGLTTIDESDLDGGELGGPTITEEQAGHLDKLLAETGSNSTAFMKFAKVTRLLDIPAARYNELVQAIESKRKAAT
jgi:hypothetical protein